MATGSNFFDAFLPAGEPTAQPRRRLPATRDEELLAALQAVSQAPPTPSVVPPEPPPEADPSFLSRLAGGAMSGLAVVGNALDLVPSMIRDVATLDNPFDQLLTPFSADNRNTGRDVLTKWGLTAPNDPDKWEAADFAGFGVDLLSGLATGGTSLGARTVNPVIRNAGLADDIMRVAPTSMGPRMARSTVTGDDLIKLRPGELHGPTVDAGPLSRYQAVETAAKELGVDDLSTIMDKPVGGVAGWSLNPFGDPTHVVGSGPLGQKIAAFLDDAGRRVTEAEIPGTDFAPVRETMRLLSPTIGEASTRVARERVMPDLIEGRRVGEETARGQVADIVQAFGKTGDLTLPTTESERALRRIFEGVDLPPSAEAAAVHDAVRGVLDRMVPDAEEWGVNLSELTDNVVKYFPRFKTKALRKGGKSRGPRIVSAEDPSAAGRLPFARGLGEGTDTIYRIIDDPVIGPMLGNADDDAVAALIRQRFSGQVPEKFVEPTERFVGSTSIAIKDRPEALASWLNGLDEAERASGVFGNHPLQDLAQRTTSFQQSLETAKRAVTALADDGVLAEATKLSKTKETMKLGELLQGLKLKTSFGTDEAGNVLGGGALRKWLELKGMPVTEDSMKIAAAMPIPKDFADDVLRVDQLFKGPAAIHPIIKAIDNATGLFKVGVLTWPARYVRDFVSGQFQNVAANQWSSRAVREADEVIRGKAANVADLAWVKHELQRSGLPNTPENAADALRKLAFRFKVVGSIDPISLPNAKSLPDGGGLDDLLSQFPGGLNGRGTPLKPVDQSVEKLRGQGTTWNPLKAEYRGVGEGAANTFAPAAAGDVIGHYSDGMNRLVPFIELLRKGVHPKEAARRIRAAQIDYGSEAQTRFGREVMGRIFPFWRFTSGSVPYTLSQLWERPGGKLAQTIRLSGGLSSSDASTPDYVAETASIPLGTLDDGSRRFLTGLGLMHEDPLSFLGGGVRGTLTEAISRANPLIKAPLEWAAGESFFQRGPNGGRELADMDPTIGRILANVTGSKEPFTFPGSDAVEFVLANSPVSRLLTTTRQLTDTRKSAVDKALTLGTGLRITDVSPGAQDAVLREKIQAAMRDDGAKSFFNVYYPDDRLGNMGDDRRERAESLEQGLAEIIKRAKARKKAAAAG